MTPAVASASPASDPGSADRSDPVAYWTAQRRAAAIPRDLVIDQRGLAYLRHPDGSFEPYGHDVAAQPSAVAVTGRPTQEAGKPGSGDTTPPQVIMGNPTAGTTINSFPYTFDATVTDSGSGVKSVSFVLSTTGYTRTFAASQTSPGTWTVTFSSISTGSWNWYVVATDKANNKTTSPSVNFTVGAAPPPPGDVVTNSEWTGAGTVQTAAGRLYFTMPSNPSGTRQTGYVCSGTVVTDSTTLVSIILTAAHCVYDDQHKAFATNVMFIPDQSASGTATDLNCSNDIYGCWLPNRGVVDVNYTTRVFPDNDKWDYAYYVVPDSGAHQNGVTTNVSPSLDTAVGSLEIQFSAPSLTNKTFAMGYSYSEDPKFMYCSEGLTQYNADDWFLPSCGLTGGSSGGPWIQASNPGSGPIMSVNSWGYTNQPGMAGPKLVSGTSTAQCVFTAAETATTNTAVQGC